MIYLIKSLIYYSNCPTKINYEYIYIKEISFIKTVENLFI
jgi:hypothetical protein